MTDPVTIPREKLTYIKASLHNLAVEIMSLDLRCEVIDQPLLNTFVEELERCEALLFNAIKNAEVAQ